MSRQSSGHPEWASQTFWMPRGAKAKAAQGHTATRAAIVIKEKRRGRIDNRQAARAVNYLSRGAED